MLKSLCLPNTSLDIRGRGGIMTHQLWLISAGGTTSINENSTSCERREGKKPVTRFFGFLSFPLSWESKLLVSSVSFLHSLALLFRTSQVVQHWLHNRKWFGEESKKWIRPEQKFLRVWGTSDVLHILANWECVCVTLCLDGQLNRSLGRNYVLNFSFIL